MNKFILIYIIDDNKTSCDRKYSELSFNTIISRNLCVAASLSTVWILTSKLYE